MVRRLLPAVLHSSSGVELIDVREYPEFASGSIPGAKMVPLATVPAESSRWDRKAAYVVVCKSGKRSMQAAEQMLNAGFTDVSILEGGTEAWITEGFPLRRSESRPWSLERQVRAVAGSMIVISALFGLMVSPWFIAWTLLVGAGLVFAGVTDTCMMASLLGRLPWNRAPQSNGSCAA